MQIVGRPRPLVAGATRGSLRYELLPLHLRWARRRVVPSVATTFVVWLKCCCLRHCQVLNLEGFHLELRVGAIVAASRCDV